MSKFIRKIKLKEDIVEIKYEEQIARVETEAIFKCAEAPHPAFPVALQNLIPTVYKILELPQGWRAGNMKITGVSFSISESTGVEGAVITGIVQLERSNAPFCFNTPHLPYGQYSETGESPLMPEDAIKILDALKEEALAYMDGKRAQLSLV